MGLNDLLYFANTSNDGLSIEIFCADLFGNKIWSHLISENEGQLIDDIIFTSNSELIVVYNSHIWLDPQITTIVKLDKDGNELLSKEFIFENAKISTATYLESGEIFLIGNFLSGDVFAVLLKENLEVKWKNNYEIEHQYSSLPGQFGILGFRHNDSTLRIFSTISNGNCFQIDINNVGELIGYEELAVPEIRGVINLIKGPKKYNLIYDYRDQIGLPPECDITRIGVLEIGF